MPGQNKPWQDLKKVLKDEEFCIKGETHKFMIISITQKDIPDDSLLNSHIKSEVIYQCTVCKKYQIYRNIHHKTEMREND